MANQAINSLALLSARYTHTSIDTFLMLCASYIYSLCQALDLRVIHMQYLDSVHSPLRRMTEVGFASALPKESLEELQLLIWEHFIHQFKETTTKDSTVRFQSIAESTQAIFMTFLTKSDHLSINSLLVGLSAIPQWTTDASALMRKHFDQSRKIALRNCQTPAYLSSSSKRIYEYVRLRMGIPLNRGLLDHATVKGTSSMEERWGDGQHIGGCVSRIYDSLRSGELMDIAMECLAELKAYNISCNDAEKLTNGTGKEACNGSDEIM